MPGSRRFSISLPARRGRASSRAPRPASRWNTQRPRASSGGIMLRTAVLLLASLLAAGQSASFEQYVGTWSGTWDGAGSGNFELTIDKTKEGAPVGRVAVTTDGGNYNADLKSIAFDGAKMSAKYEFPLDTSAEVIVGVTFDAANAKGTWSLRPKGQDAEVAGGTFSVAKK